MAISKREKLVRLLDKAGLNRLLSLAARRPGLLALAYHRIGACADQPFDDALFSADAQSFRAQVQYLRNHFDVLSGDAFVEAIQHGRLDLKRPSALITFDDGYRDNCEVAVPILRELGASAVFFIAAGYIDQPRLTWWDRVAYIVKRAGGDVLDLDYPAKLTFDFREIGRTMAIMRILRVYKQTPGIDQQHFFEHLEVRAGVPVDAAALSRNLFMSWDQVRQMKQGGMEIGAHTYNHPVLSRISEDAQRTELSRSKERLESETGAKIRLTAYPVGGHDAFDDVTKRLAREAGYCAAFSYYGGFNRPGHAELFDVRRISVERHDSLPMFCFRAGMTNLCGRAVL